MLAQKYMGQYSYPPLRSSYNKAHDEAKSENGEFSIQVVDETTGKPSHGVPLSNFLNAQYFSTCSLRFASFLAR